jgi:RNA recognition motif. (a.k.a. RRM, RBD, or RNP domain)
MQSQKTLYTPSDVRYNPIIHVSNILDNMEWNDIRKIFSAWGRVHRVTIKKNKYDQKYAIVSFYSWNVNECYTVRKKLLERECVFMYYTTLNMNQRYLKVFEFVPSNLFKKPNNPFNQWNTSNTIVHVNNNTMSRPPSPDYSPPPTDDEME